MFQPPHPESYRDQLRAFLREDWGTQDWTTAAVPDRPMRARIRAKSPLVLSGLPIAAELVHIVAPSIGVAPMAKDGDRVAPGTDVLVLKGSSHAILLAERVMLNLL